MNHKVKIILRIGGGLIAAYLLYKLYINYQANQSSANDSFLPPLQMGGYAPPASTPGNVDTGGADLTNLINSILNPPSNTNNNIGTQTSTGNTSSSPVSAMPIYGASGPVAGSGVAPVGPTPVHISGSYSTGQQQINGVGARLQVMPETVRISSTDGSGVSIV